MLEERAPDNTDWFWKVRVLYNYLREQCLELHLEQKLCIDEQIIPFKGNLNVKQDIKGKPCSWGIKLLALCDGSGLLYDFILYQSSTTELDIEQQEAFGLWAAIAMNGLLVQTFNCFTIIIFRIITCYNGSKTKTCDRHC